jgi:hypothetical protein
VDIPSIHDLLADKLTAFAPGTIGKKLGEGRDIEVIKQMYDVSFLIRHYPLAPSYRQTYVNMANGEITRRKLEIGFDEVLYDTIRTAMNIITEGMIDQTQYETMKIAIRGFVSYVRDGDFNVGKAKEAALDVLFAALLVLCDTYEAFVSIVDGAQEFLQEYKVFSSARKSLLALDPSLGHKFNQHLKVMSHFKIKLV